MSMEKSSSSKRVGTTPRRPFHRIVDGVPRCAWLDPDIYRESLKFRPEKGDLIQSTYPKSGTYWVQYITQLILKGGEPVTTYNEFTSHTHALEYMRHGDWKPELPVRLFFTHLPICKETMNREVKYVYVARNPWDVCVSFYNMMTDVSIWNFQDGTFEEFVDAFLETDLGYGSYFDHVAAGYCLKDEPNVFFVTYEDIKRDTRGAVLRLSRFLGERYFETLRNNEELLQKVVELTKPEHSRDVLVIDFKDNTSADWKNIFQRNELSCSRGHQGDKTKYPMVRTAKIGGWKEYFTPDLLAHVEKKIQEQGDKAVFMELWKDIRLEAVAMSSIVT
ncbi:sulfotransferase 1C2 isoform X3 [Dermacentor silvarum]|uniref:sulfotransferase 1C2 isoform X4 n=1 Tax=Dermacentor silvarum TaxID=543639 RepID=UPI001898091B|nr:sulfotransferase 1C2 isoform X4 [Dermacentor silvarum]XP_049519432.1 sulfotransferase 1C2 isoform X3 [Dermacentor silvarum]